MMNFERPPQPSADKDQPPKRVTGKFKSLLTGAAMGVVALAGQAEAKDKPIERKLTAKEGISKEVVFEVPESAIPDNWYEQTDSFRSEDGLFEFVVGQGISPDQSTAMKMANIDAKMKQLPSGGRAGTMNFRQVKEKMVLIDGTYHYYRLLAKKVDQKK
ncbi:MAG: hypothetical protein WCO55_04715 [Candidatus Falkowbacteria bacterium]